MQGRADVDTCVDATLERFGRIDVLVNDAQTVRLGSLMDITEDDMYVVYDTGPIGALRFMCRVLSVVTRVPRNHHQSGVRQRRPTAARAELVRSRKGSRVRVLTRCTASGIGRPRGAQVNAICPFASRAAMDGWRQAVPDEYEQALQHVYLRRIGDCEQDIGPAVVFLASEGARSTSPAPR